MWFVVGLVGLKTALPRLGKGVPDGVPGQWSETYGRVLVEEVVRSALAKSGFATLDSTPLQSGGGPRFGQSSPTRLGSVLRTDCSTLVRGSPS